MRPRALVVLLLLALIWGASFLFIRVAVREISPYTLVMLRLVIASLVLVPLAIARPALIRGWQRYIPHLFLVGLVNSALPYTLIGLGEQHITSGQASILNATTPLFAVILTATLPGIIHEKLTLARAIGTLIGFAGVAMIVGLNTLGGKSGPVLAYGACLLAAALYGVGGILARLYLGDVPLLVTVLGVEASGGLLMVPVAVATGLPTHLPSAGVIVSVLLLSILGTSVALLMYYWLIQDVGVTRTTIVTYLLPCTGLIWGAVILHEHITPNALLGLVLVLVGVAFVNNLAAIFGRQSPLPIAKEGGLDSAPLVTQTAEE
jgi:drug/metabolite transporter (DMT)-like permease